MSNSNLSHTKDYDILAFGELNLDLLITGLESMPVPGREVIAKGASLVLGSSTAICAAGMARLGLKTAMCSLVGDDDFGKKAIGFLEEYGVDTRHVTVDGDTQTGLTISLSSPSDRALVTHLGAIAETTTDNIDCDLLSRTRHIHVGSYFLQEKLRPGLPKLFAEARERGVTTSLDAGWDDTGCWEYNIKDTLAHTDVFFPNESEAMAITGKSTPESALFALADMCGIAVVKCGRQGAWLRHGGESLFAESYVVTNVADTTGAGDSFNAGFLYAYLSGFGLMQCLRYGHACAAVSVTRIGGASGCATLDEAETVLESGRVEEA